MKIIINELIAIVCTKIETVQQLMRLPRSLAARNRQTGPVPMNLLCLSRVSNTFENKLHVIKITNQTHKHTTRKCRLHEKNTASEPQTCFASYFNMQLKNAED